LIPLFFISPTVLFNCQLAVTLFLSDCLVFVELGERSSEEEIVLIRRKLLCVIEEVVVFDFDDADVRDSEKHQKLGIYKANK